MLCPLGHLKCDCYQELCAWWIKETKLCSIALFAALSLEQFKDTIKPDYKISANDILGLKKKRS
jgi:hypothetical protein